MDGTLRFKKKLFCVRVQTIIKNSGDDSASNSKVCNSGLNVAG